jgi:hypothetical protein
MQDDDPWPSALEPVECDRSEEHVAAEFLGAATAAREEEEEIVSTRLRRREEGQPR